MVSTDASNFLKKVYSGAGDKGVEAAKRPILAAEYSRSPQKSADYSKLVFFCQDATTT